MRFGAKEVVVVVLTLAFSVAAFAGIYLSSFLLAVGCLVLMNVVTTIVLLVVLRRASARAEAVARIERQIERLAVRTATDAQSNHRDTLAALEKLAGEAQR